MLAPRLLAARQQPDLPDLARQIDGRLAGGIAGADQRHLLAAAQPRLDRRGPVVHARSLELREVGDVEAAIACAARDHHRARPHRLAVADGEAVVPAGRIDRIAERHDLVRYRHLDAELLRLVVGARHQRHARNAGRKAEIVLDARRRAGLSAEGAAVEHDRRQPFRRRIDGGGQPGRSGADDGDVIELRRIDRPHQADAARQLVLARDCAAACRSDRARSADGAGRRESARSASWRMDRCRHRARGAAGRCGRGNPAAAARRRCRCGRR